MTPQAASVTSLISTLLLSDHRITNTSWEKSFSHNLDWSELREPTYLAYQNWAAKFPDHVFNSAWRYLVEQDQHKRAVSITILSMLAREYLEVRHGEVRVKTNNQGSWQQAVLSRVSSIPIQAFAIGSYNFRHRAPHASSHTDSVDVDKASWHRYIMPLLRSDHAPVKDYIESEGLNESHLHLNGSTHAEICWLRAIQHIRTETEEFVLAWSHRRDVNPIRELVAQINPKLTPLLFKKHLRAANRLRAWLSAAADERLESDARLPYCCEDLAQASEDQWANGILNLASSLKNGFAIADELDWMARLIVKLWQTPNTQLSNMLHTYILLLNQYYRLLVQSEVQYGFEQFQKLTLTELRGSTERNYRARFQAAHGASARTSTVRYLEGRFAPKTDPRKAYKLFQSILGGYYEYLKSTGVAISNVKSNRSLSSILTALEALLKNHNEHPRSFLRLTLVAHFIKQDWPPLDKRKAGQYRHYPLDQQLRLATNTLLSMMQRWPRLSHWVRGIDAAANELHAPPDIFAPVFRVCRQAGVTYRTYHAGEDFRHLICGIATMWEALEFLDLGRGDRIGHGTAMGISPDLWLDRMPSILTLSRGEWLLGVLSAWQLLRDVPDMEACVHRLYREIENMVHQVFGRSISVAEFERAMALRGLSRFDLMRYLSAPDDQLLEPINEQWRIEFLKVKEAYHNNPASIRLLWEWLSQPSILKRADELIAIESMYLDAECYVRLQQALMAHVSRRGIIIETLPSSNVRISQYQHICEHHSFRWMRVPGDLHAGDPEIMVCLGSDDPGIFASDIETEFYLLYSSLIAKGLSDSDALARLKALNDRGRIFRFHHPLLN